MALLTKQELAVRISKPTNYLSVYITRKKIILNENELFDDKNPTNVAFLVKMGALNSVKTDHIETVEAEEVPNTAKLTKKKTNDSAYNEAVMNEAALEKKKKELDIEKKQADIEAVKLKNAITKGELIPFGLMEPLISQNNQSITTAFKNAAYELLSTIEKKHDLSKEAKAEYNGLLVTTINDAIKKAQEQSIRALNTLIENYQLTIK
jgi:hypothetical protein